MALSADQLIAYMRSGEKVSLQRAPRGRIVPVRIQHISLGYSLDTETQVRTLIAVDVTLWHPEKGRYTVTPDVLYHPTGDAR